MDANHPFHAGEEAVQARLGVRERMADVGRRVIRDHLPDQHRTFYSRLPFVLIGSIDSQHRPWASILVGTPGFLQSDDPRRLRVGARPIPGDPLEDGLRIGAPLGFLGIELPTRRRNRVNAHVTDIDGNGFSTGVDQTIGNCPQYIQSRDFDQVRDMHDTRPRQREDLSALDAQAQAQIGLADTLFVASHSGNDAPSMASGADVSHRGGRAGFVRIESARSLLVPEFSGNKVYMTLGNFMVEPRAGLLFIDFERGDLLMLTGHVELLWDAPQWAGFDGAERAWRFRIDAGLRLRDALPMRFGAPSFSPQSLATGAWQ